MKSIRTTLTFSERESFRTFLDCVKLEDVKIGSYEDIDDHYYVGMYICYCYSEKAEEVVAILTHITLKYGSLQNAYNNFMNALLSSSVNDPYFNWIP